MIERKRVWGLSALQESLLLWAASFLAIIVAFLTLPSQSSLVATVSFLYFPYIFMRQRDEDYRDYGVTLTRWREDLRNVLILSAVLAPLFFLGFWSFVRVLTRLPPALGHLLTPLEGSREFHARLPVGFAQQLVGQLLVVALPEEFFYRGYLQARLRQVWPGGHRLLGVQLGPAFFVTALLFSLGHLAIFQAWRLWVFFPALLFGWLREKTGTIAGATLFHALCNLYEMFLEASFAPSRYRP